MAHLICLLGVEQAHAQTVRSDTIPFELTAFNNVIVPVVINGTDTLRLMFHSSFTGVSVTRSGLEHTTTLHADGEGIAHSWGGETQSGVSVGNTVRIGQNTWDSVLVTIDEQSGQESDGKFGWDHFADRVLEIDYDRSELVVHPSMPTLPDGATLLPFEERNGSLYVQSTIAFGETSVADLFMFHTGYGGTCILGTGFMSRFGNGPALDTLGTKKLSDSFGNVLLNITARIPSLTFADHEFKNVHIQVMDRRSHFEDSVLGNDILRRFNSWIDFRAHRIYLKPSKAMGATFSDRF